jgi:spermidine synthase
MSGSYSWCGRMGIMSHRQGGSGGFVVCQQVDSGVVELVPDSGRLRAWTLLLDGTPQSHVDLDDPGYLEFEYMRRLGHIADLASAPAEPLRVLHLGGGGLTLARYVTATRPGSWQIAVESDGALVEFVRNRLPLTQADRRTRVRVRVGDARAVLEQASAGSFDLVIADVFAGATTAAHLTSAEFAAAAGRALTASGVYAVNIGDGPPLAHTKARVTAVLGEFGHACLIADAAVLKGRRFGNLVLAASQQRLPVADLARRVVADPLPGRLIHGTELDRFAAGAKPITDASPQASPAPPEGLFGPGTRPKPVPLRTIR